MPALGLVETRGLLAAIEGADAMLKAADVRLLEKSLASGGLVTITIAGEVSAVAASVDAAVAAIGRLRGELLVSHHVIARPDVELEHIVSLTPKAAPVAEAAPLATPDDAAPEAPALNEPVDAAETVDEAAAPAPESAADGTAPEEPAGEQDAPTPDAKPQTGKSKQAKKK
jgi:microcompartment protein CcmL/EutN